MSASKRPLPYRGKNPSPPSDSLPPLDPWPMASRTPTTISAAAPGPDPTIPGEISAIFDELDRMGLQFFATIPPPEGVRKAAAPMSVPMPDPKMGRKMLLTLARVAEQRDHGSYVRVTRMHAYSMIMAQWLLERMPELFPTWARDPDVIGAVCAVQNVGNISVPPGLLSTPRRLTRYEKQLVKHHPRFGAALLDAYLAIRPGSVFIRMARDACAFHHESWDGSGYPFGIKGDEIPMVAQLAAVVDAFDALTSHRFHRRAYRARDACAYVLGQSGVKFGPVVVEAFKARQEALAWVYLQLGDAPVSPQQARRISPTVVQEPEDAEHRGPQDPVAAWTQLHGAASSSDGPVMTALMEAASSRTGGELMVISADGMGRVYVHDGRVAWAHASNLPGVLTQSLVQEHHIPADRVRALIEECRRNGTNFGETLISNGLISRESFRSLLRHHVAERLKRILTFDEPEVRFMPLQRTYATDLTFDLREVLS